MATQNQTPRPLSDIPSFLEKDIAVDNTAGTTAPSPERFLPDVDNRRDFYDQEVELIPGTEIIDDLNGVYSQNGVLETKKHIILLPQPSNDPHDPLNWSSTWKTIVITNQALFVFVSVLTPLCIAPMTPIFMEIYHKDVKQVNLLFGVAAIALGWANLAIVPFANVFGRRQTSLICGLICVLANIWQAVAKDYNSFLAARIVSGLGAAANESIMPMIISDLMFIHQRGLWLGLYFWAYFLGVMVGPSISGNVAQDIDFHWFFWICTILQGTSLLCMIFFLPETMFHRKRVEHGLPVTTHRTSHETTNSRSSHSEIPAMGQGSTGDHGIQQAPIPAVELKSPITRKISPVDQNFGIGRPSLQQFNWWPKPIYFDRKVVLRDVVAPLYIFSFPIILWAALSMGFASNCLLGLNLTQSQVFSAPPYLFTPSKVGCTNFAFVVGGIIGLLLAGPLSDFISLRAARRNKGVREAEFRLIALIPFIIICLVGMVVVAVGFQRHYSWEVVVAYGFVSVGIQVVSIPAISISYAIDCYPNLTGEILVAATIVKNTFGFGMIFFLTDWATSSGYIPPILTLMALAVGFTTLGTAIFPFYGKQLRRLSKNSKIHCV